MKNKAITSRDEDFAQWYTDVVKAAKLADYSNTKGCVVFEPNGYAIWEKMQEVLDKKFKELGHQNVYMPVLIPESLLKKEGELKISFTSSKQIINGYLYIIRDNQIFNVLGQLTTF